MNTDPIADMLNRIRNAYAVEKKSVELPFSRVKFAIAKILEQEGFIQKVEQQKRKTRKTLEITLRYHEGRSAIVSIKRISKPGLRVYLPSHALRSMKGGYAVSILSTSKGLMTDRDAKKQNVGGEVLCQIYR